jgi:hypothetical protein
MGKIMVDCSQSLKTVGQGRLQNVPFLSTRKMNLSPFYGYVLAFISVVFFID